MNQRLQDLVSPHFAQWVKAGFISAEHWAKFAQQTGMVGVSLEENGLDRLREFAAELFQFGQGGLVSTFAINEIALRLLASFETPLAQKALGETLAGEARVALCISEPDAGSDVAGLRLEAREQEDGRFLLEGEKCYISNGPVADYYLVAARTNPAMADTWKGISLFLLYRGTQGLHPYATPMVGIKVMPLGGIRFQSCLVEAETLLGRKHRGFQYLMSILGFERLVIAILSSQYAKHILASSLEQLKTRRLFGQSLSDFQHVRFELAKLHAEWTVTHRFTLHLIEEFQRGQAQDSQIWAAKYRNTELLKDMAERLLQFFGAKGFVAEHWAANLYNDVRWLALAGGSNELILDMLARDLLNHS